MERRKFQKRDKVHLEYDLNTKSKVCGCCLERKPFEEFHKRLGSLDGYGSRCKCCDDRARKKWKRDNPERSHISQRNRNLKHKYGIDIEEYLVILDNQKGCAICGIKENNSSYGINKSLNFSVDHDHSTGKIRGLLCNNCNRALGLLQDSTELLEKAIKYLERNLENS